VGVARGTIFQSYAHPGMYIRHWGQQLYVASDGGTSPKASVETAHSGVSLRNCSVL
jgi:hypothetical protein